ncbi:MAG: lysylphosphatidylglycerol synthase transmembrane domain-containing protein [Caldilineaceae bacterium]
MKRQRIQLLIGFAISALFIYYLLPGLKLDEVGAALATANYWWIVPGVIVYFIGLGARTWRWHYMLRHLKPVPLGRLFPVVCIGYFGNNVYPFRAGEIIRSWVLKRKEGIPIASSLTTVIIERIFDGLVMLLFVFLALPFAPIPDAYRQFVVLLTVLLVLATALFVWMAMQPERMARLYGWFAARLLPATLRRRTDDIFQRFMEGIRSLSSPRDIGMIFITSIAVWLMETVKYWFVMHAFPFNVSFLALMLMNGIVNLATTLPSAPGYVGTFDTPGIETLVAYGVGRDLAAAYTAVLHVALWVPVTAVGAWFFWREQLTWDDFSVAKEAAADSGPRIADGKQ